MVTVMQTQTTTTEAEGMFSPGVSAAPGRRLTCYSARYRSSTSGTSGPTAVFDGLLGRPRTVSDEMQAVGSSSRWWLSVVWSRP
jgi:hypothetical protein